MSVINTMLRDLEKRQQHDLYPEHKRPAPEKLEHPEHQSHFTLWILFIICFATSVGLAVFYTDHFYKAPTLDTTQHISSIDLAWKVIQNQEKQTMAYPYPFISKIMLRHAPQPIRHQVKAQPTTKDTARKPIKKEGSISTLKRSSNIVKKPFSTSQKVVNASSHTLESKGAPTQTQKKNKAQPSALAQLPSIQEKSSVAKEHVSDMQMSEAVLTPEEQHEKAVAQAVAAEQKGEIHQAISAYQRALQALPHDHKTRHALMTLWTAKNQYEQAETVLKQGILLFPEQRNLSFTLAKLQMHQGHTQQALNTLIHLKSKAKDRLQHLRLQSQLAHHLEKFDIAEQSYKELAQLQPQQGRWWFGLAFAFDSQQEYHRAIIAYQHAIKQKNLSHMTQKYAQDRIQILFRILQGDT